MVDDVKRHGTKGGGRDGLLTIRISFEERKMLEDLSAKTGLPVSDVVRQAFRREHKNKSKESTPKEPTT